MSNPYTILTGGARGRQLLAVVLLLLGLLPGTGQAQNTPPAWQPMLLDIDWPTNPAPTVITASTTDADGNFIIVGTYTTTVTLGATTFTRTDPNNPAAYIAKWSPVTRAYVWALSLDNGFDTEL